MRDKKKYRRDGTERTQWFPQAMFRSHRDAQIWLLTIDDGPRGKWQWRSVNRKGWYVLERSRWGKWIEGGRKP